MSLPDLTPWANEQLGFVYDWTIQGNDLRLTSAIANIGTGPLELRGGETIDDKQLVYQRIYDTGGSYVDVLAGTFIHHIEHDHIHFEEFAEFRLRAVTSDGGVGDVVAAGDKVSFCLLDVERYGNFGPAIPNYLSCGQVQGISPGWADVYDRGLPGQSIEITNVANGEYWLEVVADPLNRIVESDETNNVTRIKISLVRPDNNDPIPPDTFEPNNTLATASILAPPELHTYSNLSIHASLNDDYYRITAALTGFLAVDLALSHADGDVDLEILDASGASIANSVTAANREHVLVEATAGEYFFIRVSGYEGATNPDYTMVIDPAYAALPNPAANPFTEAADSLRLSQPGRGWKSLGGDDTVYGTSARDVVFGGNGRDLLRGEGGSDDLYGDAGADSLQGGSGNDWLDGGSGVDFALYSTATAGVRVDLARSTATGGAGTDTLVSIEDIGGSPYSDVLHGNGLSNRLFGDRGSDYLEGLGGDDFLTGGSGRDFVTGGQGRDRFVFNSASETGNTLLTSDTINDFKHGIDMLDLRGIDASSVLGGNNVFAWRGSAGFTSSANGELRVVRHDNAGISNDFTILHGDTDGDTASEFQVKFTGLISLTASDILL